METPAPAKEMVDAAEEKRESARRFPGRLSSPKVQDCFAKAWDRVVEAVLGLNFIQIHYIYFLATCLVTGIIFWGTSTPARSVSFTDSIFLTTSAMTEAGLNTVNLSELNKFQQIMLFVLIIMGSSIFVSAFVVLVRKNAFEDRFLDEVDRERRRRKATFFNRMPSRVRTLSLNRARTLTIDRRAPTASSSELRHPVETEGVRGRTVSRIDNQGTADQGNQANGIATRIPEGLEQAKHDEAKDVPPTVASPTDSQHDRITFSPSTRFNRQATTGVDVDERGNYVLSHLLPRHGIGATPNARPRSRSAHSAALSIEPRTRTTDKHGPNQDDISSPLSTGILARNSTFHHMSEEDRERLGGLEYKAVRLLSYLVPAYLVTWQLFGAIGLGAYVLLNRPDTARENGLNPFWVGAFNAISAFNNSGMSLLDANMIAFQNSVYMLISMSLFILAGNTCYPIFLRLICWTAWKLFPDSERFRGFRATLRFLLDHPRRVYTNFFPSRETWWLLICVIFLNGIDCAFFAILNIGNDAITRLSPGFEFLDGLFQAFAVRSGGFYVVPIPSTRISLQFLYVVMMYIGVYPVVITMRNSNIYEERSLGIYTDDPGYEDYEQKRRRSRRQRKRSVFGMLLGHSGSRHNKIGPGNSGAAGRYEKYMFVQQQLRAQLAHDLWWLVLAVWLITIVEAGSFEREPTTFSVFNVIFEVVSAYGTVGISVGVPDNAYSFCGAWHVLSKLILCAVMIRGRHRGLPVAIDKAVMLPRDGKGLADMEEEDAKLRFERARTIGRAGEGDGDGDDGGVSSSRAAWHGGEV